MLTFYSPISPFFQNDHFSIFLANMKCLVVLNIIEKKHYFPSSAGSRLQLKAYKVIISPIFSSKLLFKTKTLQEKKIERKKSQLSF